MTPLTEQEQNAIAEDLKVAQEIVRKHFPAGGVPIIAATLNAITAKRLADRIDSTAHRHAEFVTSNK